MIELNLGFAIALLLGLGAGAALTLWLRARRIYALESEKSALAIELASTGERANRASELERQLAAQALELNTTKDRHSTLQAEAACIPGLQLRLDEAEAANERLTTDLAELRESLGRLNAELKAERDLTATLRKDVQSLATQFESANAAVTQLSVERADLATRLDAERQQAAEKLQLLHEAKQALTNEFKALAGEILDEKSRKFTEQNQTNLGQLLDPLKTKLSEFQAKVDDVYVKESKDRSALAEQVKQLLNLNQTLSDDAKNLTQALKGSSKTQGNWGELVLERLLESSGLRKGEEYVVQASHTREDGSRAQPDVIIHLPEQRDLVVDSKVSLRAYEESVSAESDEQRSAAIQRHIVSVRTHIRGLSDKNYQSLYQLKSLDCVLMFIPLEPAFMLAVTHDRELFMDAWSRNVILVSPSTLMFVVRTVAHLWRQEAQKRNAQEIAARGAKLYDQLVNFVADLEKVGERIQQAQASYLSARGKLVDNKGTNVIRQAEMLKDLGVKPTKQLPPAMVSEALDSQEVLPIASSDPAEPDSVNGTLRTAFSVAKPAR